MFSCYDTDVTGLPCNISCIGNGINNDYKLSTTIHACYLRCTIYSRCALPYAQGFHHVSSPPLAWNLPRDWGQWVIKNSGLHHCFSFLPREGGSSASRSSCNIWRQIGIFRTVDGWYCTSYTTAVDSVQKSINRHAVLSFCFSCT